MYEHPQELTDQEIKLGFKIIQIDNPTSHLAFNPPTVPAVVYTIDKCNRILKDINPITNIAEYYHQKYGIAKGLHAMVKDAPAKWNPTKAIATDPVMLITAVRSMIERGESFNIDSPDNDS